MLSSNIGPIIARLRLLQEVIPEAIKEAVSPKRWKPRLKADAIKTLRGLAGSERNPARRDTLLSLVPKFVVTLTAEWVGGGSGQSSVGSDQSGSRFTMSSPEETDRSVGVTGAMGIMERLTTREYPGGQVRTRRIPLAPEMDEEVSLEAVREGLRQWVETDKIRTERDLGLTDDDIVERLMFIMGIHPNHDPRLWTEAMKQAAERLAPVLQEFMESGEFAGQSPALSRELIEQWLGAVLVVWMERFRNGLPVAIQVQMARKLHKLAGR